MGVQTFCTVELLFILLELKNCTDGILLAAEKGVDMALWTLVDSLGWENLDPRLCLHLTIPE